MIFPKGCNAVSLKKKNLIVRRAVPENYELGQIQIESLSGNPIRVYDLERTTQKRGSGMILFQKSKPSDRMCLDSALRGCFQPCFQVALSIGRLIPDLQAGERHTGERIRCDARDTGSGYGQDR